MWAGERGAADGVGSTGCRGRARPDHARGRPVHGAAGQRDSPERAGWAAGRPAAHRGRPPARGRDRQPAGRRRAGNPLGWYPAGELPVRGRTGRPVRRPRLPARHGTLPLGWLAVVVAAAWPVFLLLTAILGVAVPGRRCRRPAGAGPPRHCSWPGCCRRWPPRAAASPRLPGTTSGSMPPARSAQTSRGSGTCCTARLVSRCWPAGWPGDPSGAPVPAAAGERRQQRQRGWTAAPSSSSRCGGRVTGGAAGRAASAWWSAHLPAAARLRGVRRLPRRGRARVAAVHDPDRRSAAGHVRSPSPSLTRTVHDGGGGFHAPDPFRELDRLTQQVLAPGPARRDADGRPARLIAGSLMSSRTC